jgi:hypothetical protein
MENAEFQSDSPILPFNGTNPLRPSTTCMPAFICLLKLKSQSHRPFVPEPARCLKKLLQRCTNPSRSVKETAKSPNRPVQVNTRSSRSTRLLRVLTPGTVLVHSTSGRKVYREGSVLAPKSWRHQSRAPRSAILKSSTDLCTGFTNHCLAFFP